MSAADMISICDPEVNCITIRAAVIASDTIVIEAEGKRALKDKVTALQAQLQHSEEEE